MTDTTPDPRVVAAAERLRRGNWYPSEYVGHLLLVEHWCQRAAAAVIESIDAADEASGVRRVSVQEFDSLQREVRQAALREAADEVHIEARWQLEMAARRQMRSVGSPVGRLQLLEEILLNRASGIAATDSPVGGEGL